MREQSEVEQQQHVVEELEQENTQQMERARLQRAESGSRRATRVVLHLQLVERTSTTERARQGTRRHSSTSPTLPFTVLCLYLFTVHSSRSTAHLL